MILTYYTSISLSAIITSNEQGMEEFSQAVLEERDSINEQLLLKEAEIEKERILRIELNDRLHELQNKVQ